MAIPDTQSLYKPLLKFAADEKEHKLFEAHEAIANELNLTEQEKNEKWGGKYYIFYNRLRLAKDDLVRFKCFEKTRIRGYFKITTRGIELWKENPSDLNLKYLKDRYDAGPPPPQPPPTQPPEELLEQGYNEIRKGLASEIMDQIKTCSPHFFEQLVVDLMLAMGYGGSRIDAGLAIGRSGGGGIDGIIKEDKLGLDVVYLQAKRWEGTVGRPVVQAFAGSLEGHRANKGVMITTSSFSKDAYEYVKNIGKKIVLIDGEKLTELMIDHDLGVSTAATYEVKKMDLDYFAEE